MPKQLFRLSIAQQREVEHLVADFEGAWAEGRRPAIAKYLPAAGEVRAAALVELVFADVEFRERAGQQPRIEEYLADFPELAMDVRALDSLADIAAASEPPRVELEVVSGPHRGAKFQFDSHASLLAGRARIAQLQLRQDRHFSRHHFRLVISPPRVHLIDLDSRNGTFVNGNRVRQLSLANGDVISGGRTKIRVTATGAAAEPSSTAPTVINTVAFEPTAAYEANAPVAAQETALAVPVPQVPGYELQQELGQGSMGIVYRALQKSSGNILAIKLIKPNVAPSLDRLRMFVREANILSKLKHRHIIRFIEMGTAVGGELFVATEFVDVVTLETLLAEQPLPIRVKVICGIACQVLDALKYAHENGLVHRDIKPTNILLTRATGKLNAKLGDFGLAKNYADAGFSDLTNDGDLRGSPSYLSPEQIINARYATPACDIYSLGVSLYQMFSGRLPYEVPCGSILRAILESPPVPLHERCPELPAEVFSLIHKAIEKDPDKRFRCAAEMYEACLPFRKGTAPDS